MKKLSASILLALTAAAHADPQLTSWFTANSGKYARIYTTSANETAGTTSTSTATGWTRTTGSTTYAQASPAYADVNEISYSTNWVYIRTTGLASHIMGPWYLDASKTQLFPSLPTNTATIYRIPRTPVIPTTKTSTGLGATGRMVNGVSMFDSRDAFSYSNANSTDATPVNGITGDGIWNRDGYHNEGVTFDPALAHQAGNNYHYHAHPIGLRYQLGDHVDYNTTTNRYTESATAPTAHSPIVAWAADGIPVYGPYGYSSPMNAASGVRRMVSGFTKRDGTNGTTAITVRQVLPLWAQRIQGRTTLTASQYGPAISTTYALGHYIEDFDYRGDLGQTLGVDFDLNEQNVRFCVTPEYPSGTWAYFTTINADGTPQYPYTTGRQYYGSPTGGGVASITESVTQQFIGGANKALTINTPAVGGTTVTLTWSAVEGGSYSVDASPNQSTWTSKATGIVSTGISANTSYTALATSGTEYCRVNRTALATYDSSGQTAATVSQSTTTSYSLTPNTSPTITGISNQTLSRNGATSALSFTVGDAETVPTSLVVTASSSNTTLVPNANIVISGTGASRTVTVTPALGQSGIATITVTVNDGISTTSTAFTVTVKQPNILFIVADDYGIDASYLYNMNGGVSLPPTPNIATLAANGVRFTNAYAYPVCSPTRSAVLTGRHGFRTGTGTAAAAASNNLLQSSEFTLPDAFAANSSLNYQLKQFGKWHLGGGSQAPGSVGGWPSFAGSLQGAISDYYSWTKVVTDGTVGGTTSTTSTNYATTDVVDDAVSFINTQTAANKPWLAWVAFNAPHTPLHKPPSSLCPTYASLSGTTADINANPLNYYNAMVEAMDTEIGRLLASVDLANTDIIFIGDNGTPLNVLQSPFPSGHGKDTLYEGGVRVPLIIRGPDVISPGRSSAVLTHVVDLYSTMLGMAGINVATTVPGGVTLDSQSLMSVLQNQSATRSYLYDEIFDIQDANYGGRSLRDSQYKLIRNKSGTDEFYDLNADPYESTNLFAGGYAAMTTTQQTAYSTLVSQLGSFNTAPTISTVANQSTTTGTATGAIAFTVGDAELSPSILTVTATSSNTTLLPNANVVLGGSGTSRTVTLTPAAGQNGTSTITLSVTDGAFTATTSFTLTVASTVLPVVNTIATNPIVPTSSDAVFVTANAQASAGRTLSSVQLTYGTDAQTTNTVFNETMGAAAVTGWTGTGTVYPWTVVYQGAPTSFKQTAAGNHTASGQGNQFGMEVYGNSPTLANNHITTTNAIDATGSSGTVEFWISTSGMTGAQGWDFQTSTDGTTWTTRLSDLNIATSYGFTQKTYTLGAAERVGTLKLRFRFAGGGMNQPPSIRLDDIKVTTTGTAAPVTLTMFDDGLHGDAAAGDGIYGASIPVQSAGTTVGYTIAATDNLGGVTTTGSASYTVVTPSPVLSITPSNAFTTSGPVGGAFSPASATYTLSNSGTGPLNWTAGKGAAWLDLSATAGTLAAGASTNVAATLNSSANSLSVGNYSDTITFTNASNGSGSTTRGASLAVLSTNANLSSLLLSNGSLSPAFSTGTESYTASVSNSIGTITITPTTQDGNASVTVNGAAVASGSASASIALAVGETSIPIVVTPQSGTPTKTYTVAITRLNAVQSWRQLWFGTSSNSGNAADTADPFHTGLSNLSVFAFFGPNQNPATAGGLQLPQPVLSGGNFAFSFAEPSGVSGITYGAQWSATMFANDWHDITDTGSGSLHVFSVPIGGNTQIFMRLKVTAQ